LATGETSGTDDDDIAAAYRFYDIKDRTAELDLTVLQLQLDLIIGDEKEQAERKEKATRYFELLSNNHQASPVIKMAPDYSTPVGLNNTRNYCYLHALLQFLYAIEPFRDTIIKFEEEYQQHIETAEDAELGKLAGTLITKLQVEDGHALVPLLTTLFKQLESAPGPNITASEAVAKEALRPPPQAIESRDNNNNDGEPSGGSVKPHGPTEGATPGSESSDVTLVGDVLTPVSDTGDAQNEAETTSSTAGNASDDDGKMSPPSHSPPPVPPRPTTIDTEAAVEQYKQQDAHEVASKIIQRTIGAIKPTDIDADGERHDPIRDLFYVVTQPICTKNSKEQKKYQPEFGPNLFLHLNLKPKDIQEGLDIAFGKTSTSDASSDESARYSVMKAAPSVLQIYIHHYQFVRNDPKDKTSAFSRERVWPSMKLNEEIYLDRYMENNQEAILPVRETSWELRDRLIKLGADRKDLIVHGVKSRSTTAQDEKDDVDIGDALGAILSAMEHESKEEEAKDDSDELQQALKTLSEEEQAKVAAIDQEIPQLRAKLDALPLDRIDTDGMKYRLFAVFM
jgi:ubiquitin carboxyl-terminal hydrolase 25/28